MKKQKNKGRRQKIFGVFRESAIVIALSLILGQASAGGTVYASQNAVADADTRQDYKVTLGAENSTRNAGRIWVDKSVSTEDLVFSGDLASDRIQIEKGDADFLEIVVVRGTAAVRILVYLIQVIQIPKIKRLRTVALRMLLPKKKQYSGCTDRR